MIGAVCCWFCGIGVVVVVVFEVMALVGLDIR